MKINQRGNHYFFQPILRITNSNEKKATPLTGNDLNKVMPNPLKKVLYPSAL